MDDDPLPARFTSVVSGQVVLARPDPLGAEQRPGDLREPMWQQMQWPGRMAQRGALVPRERQRGVGSLGVHAIAGRHPQRLRHVHVVHRYDHPCA